MKLYLAQHGDAVSKDVDPERPLSDQGRQDVNKIAEFLKASPYTVENVLHSGKTRALQSAQILSHALTDGGGVEKCDDVNPNDPTDSFIQRLNNLTTNTLLVGHLPFLGKLAATLLTDNENPDMLSFQPGSVVCLDRRGEGQWSLLWMLRPDLLA